jgi:hypothetical protein
MSTIEELGAFLSREKRAAVSAASEHGPDPAAVADPSADAVKVEAAPDDRLANAAR